MCGKRVDTNCGPVALTGGTGWQPGDIAEREMSESQTIEKEMGRGKNAFRCWWKARREVLVLGRRQGKRSSPQKPRSTFSK